MSWTMCSSFESHLPVSDNTHASQQARQLTASRRWRDKRVRHRNVAIPPNELPQENVNRTWQNVATCAHVKQNIPNCVGFVALLRTPRVSRPASASRRARQDDYSMKHRSVPKEKCPQCLSLRGPLGDTPPVRSKRFMSPCTAPRGTNTVIVICYKCIYFTFIVSI